ncbi:hypothetical protein C5B42_00800 [Candidatus Cerribacteria bacterium 'Amazon FNV 2010 28 9']|uniref:Glycosyl transferase family 1 domain-containing protein n=1 Tax=Candidatus Cerribacteria bacterium 'Amazon FNV 2010 28 9' TaxID=2081795 RepID=A0A317JQT7_9BACT|nr:MAG: hypothetical protein C5B42_00800 [Candidatus Cerribacteria bacterium 'Amazon FNV 2010 28 9']
MKKRIALYSAYIPKHAGGGEKYLLSIGEVCSQCAQTELLVSQTETQYAKNALRSYEQRFGLQLEDVLVKSSSIGATKSPITTFLSTAQFSHLFAMTDGSIFPTAAKHSHLIVQVPWTRRLSMPEQLKLKNWESIIVYSHFVKSVLERSWKINKIQVIAPYVDAKEFAPQPKEKIILNVGRFFKHATSNSKRQDVIINAFKKLYDKGHIDGFSLVLIGNVDPNPDSQEYLEELKKLAYGYPINIITDASYEEMKSYYARSLFYWHAAGFEVDEVKNPEHTEHFGITTLEAMASGCIPLVVPKGGQKEVVADERFFWETQEDLLSKTSRFVEVSKSQQEKLAQEVRSMTTRYSKEQFIANIQRLVE